MPENVEIKAVIRDWTSTLALVESLSDTPRQVLHQQDTFFRAATGRLKLREITQDNCSTAELIWYHRPDSPDAKRSTYQVTPISHPAETKSVLSHALGTLGTVKKERWLYLASQTRIHLDRVENLGTYLELEVVLSPGQSEGEGTTIARQLMEQLSIAPSDLLPGAYLDLARNSNAPSVSPCLRGEHLPG